MVRGECARGKVENKRTTKGEAVGETRCRRRRRGVGGRRASET